MTGFVASDPASPGYNWTWLDGVMKDLTAHGLGVCLTLYNAPAWAQAPGRPASFPEGNGNALLSPVHWSWTLPYSCSTNH